MDFHENRYWDIEVRYAKRSQEEIHANILAYNSGPDQATLHLLSTLWFRNTWSWGKADAAKPHLKAIDPPQGAASAVQAIHPTLGSYYLYGRQSATGLLTENDTNAERLWGIPNATHWIKDAFHRYLVQGKHDAVNPAHEGTKFAAWHRGARAEDGGQPGALGPASGGAIHAQPGTRGRQRRNSPYTHAQSPCLESALTGSLQPGRT